MGKVVPRLPAQDVGEVERTMRQLEEKGRIERAYLPLNMRRVPSGTARGFCTYTHASTKRPQQGRESYTLGRRTYATTAEPKRVALIGARGYTGRSLVQLINAHPNLALSHVSSRELAGLPLDGYTKEQVYYANIGPEDLKKLESGRSSVAPPDVYIMALPNGVCRPFVDAVREGGKGKAQGHGVIVDLSADHRFDDAWTYGLPGAFATASRS